MRLGGVLPSHPLNLMLKGTSPSHVTVFIVPWIELLCAYTGRSSTSNTPNSVLFTLFITLGCHKSKAYCLKDSTIGHLIRFGISPTVLLPGLDHYSALTACRSPQQAINFLT